MNIKEEVLKGNISETSVYEIPERMDVADAIWYYNLLADRREEIYRQHFARLQRMEEWLEIYALSEQDSAAHDLAFMKLSALQMDVSGWIALHEARFHDENIIKLCHSRIEVVAGQSFERWAEVFDLAQFGSALQQLAMRRMKPLANKLEDWQAIYDRSALGSANQINALQNVLLLSRFDTMRRRREEDENDDLERAASKGPLQWRQEYESRDLYDKAGQIALINVYISADMREAAKEQRNATTKPTKPTIAA
ncbi:MAG: hypothetical protein LBN32_04560 [Helicobacteraceae bacterium]|nr:hypothetical protein [Helicobacteraceae bacterium]